MTKEEAKQKIEKSLAEGAQVISPKGVSYEEYLKGIVDRLFNHLIEPKVVTIKSTCFPEYDFEKYKKSKVWAIAKLNNHWLLTLDDENEFALGFGESENDITMHGFSSSDAVGEWCA